MKTEPHPLQTKLSLRSILGCLVALGLRGEVGLTDLLLECRLDLDLEGEGILRIEGGEGARQVVEDFGLALVLECFLTFLIRASFKVTV